MQIQASHACICLFTCICLCACVYEWVFVRVTVNVLIIIRDDNDLRKQNIKKSTTLRGSEVLNSPGK